MPLDAAYLVKIGHHFFFYAAYREPGRPRTQYVYAFTGETAQLNCSIQPGRARRLYSAEWYCNNRPIANTTFSLLVPVQNVSQNATIYQCIVTVRSCFPISRCLTGNQIAVGDPIILVVGGECTL